MVMDRVNKNTRGKISQLRLHARDRRPLYEQLAYAIAELIRDGELAEGTRLPALREIAKLHGVALVTASQAYEVLAAEGLVSSRTGRGTFVSFKDHAAAQPSLQPSWGNRHRSPLQQPTDDGAGREWTQPYKVFSPQSRRYETFELLRASARPGAMALSAGHTAPETYPLSDFAECFARTFLDDPPAIHQYRVDRGDVTLREACAERLRARGADVSADDILIVSGAQQALSLVTDCFVREGDVVAAEAPTYFSALETFDQRHVSWVSVTGDRDGILVDSFVNAAAKFSPRVLYVNSAAQNPTGSFLARSRHRQVLAAAERANMTIVEDQTCWQLSYDGEPPPPLFASDRSGRVVLIESFSKMLFPSLRVGFIAAKGAAMNALYAAKLRADSFTTTVSQRALVRFLQSKAPARHLRAARSLYRRRRDALVEALARNLTADVRMTVPAGGLNMWIELPVQWSARELLTHAAAAGLLFLPGSPFYPTQPATNTLRLSYGALPESHAPEAAARFGRALRSYASAQRKNSALTASDPAITPAV